MTAKHVLKAGSGSFMVSGSTATMTVTRNWDRLLTAAEAFHKAKEYSVAVIVAQTACEVVAERAIDKAFADKNIEDIGVAVTEFFVTSSLTSGNAKVRNLYEVLTGDKSIAKTKFWQSAVELSTTRNRAAHAGRTVSQKESESGLKAATAFVAHVVQHNNL